MSTLGERIKKVRKSNNLKQEDFAKSLSVSRSFISRIESDKEKVSETVLKLISLQYNVSLEWLLYEKGEYLISAGNDYFERGFEKEFKSEIIPEFNNLLIELNKINSASIYLSAVAIIGEYTNLLKLYSNSKNIGIVVFDELSNIVIDLLNTVSLCEKEPNIIEIERKFNLWLINIEKIIKEMEKSFIDRKNV